MPIGAQTAFRAVSIGRHRLQSLPPAAATGRIEGPLGNTGPATRTSVLPELRHHLRREQARRLPRIAPEELDHEVRAAERAVALDAFGHAGGVAPQAVLLEGGAQVPAEDLARLLQRRARRRLVLGDHHAALLRDLDLVEVAAHLGAALLQHLDLVSELRLVDGEVVPQIRAARRDAQQHALPPAADEQARAMLRLGLAERVLHAHVPAVQAPALLAPEPRQDLGDLVEGAHAFAEPPEREAP